MENPALFQNKALFFDSLGAADQLKKEFINSRFLDRAFLLRVMKKKKMKNFIVSPVAGDIKYAESRARARRTGC